MSMWHKVKERLQAMGALPVQKELESDPDIDTQFAADVEMMAAKVSPDMNLRLLQASQRHDVNKAELIRACINLALPALDENPHLIPLLDTVPQKNLNVYKKYKRNIL